MEAGTRAMPWAEWKAGQLNRVFEEHGVTGKPSRITAETVRGSGNRETANETREGADKTTERPSAHETAHLLSGDDPALTGARSEIAGLLAIAYQRYAGIRRVGIDRHESSVDGGLANSGAPSVHGVVS